MKYMCIFNNVYVIYFLSGYGQVFHKLLTILPCSDFNR